MKRTGGWLYRVITRKYPVIDRLTAISPRAWGILFVVVVVAFAVFYVLMPESWINCSIQENSPRLFINALYFSIITITTLGFGDIYPVNIVAKCVVIAETLIGVAMIGFFLNSVALKRSSIDANIEKRKNARKEIECEKGKLKRHFIACYHVIDKHIYNAAELTTPIEKRRGHVSYDPNFDFHDMYDLYNPSMNMQNNFTQPIIVHFYRSLHKVEESLETMLYRVNLTFWPDLEQKILKFLMAVRETDYESSILSYLDHNYQKRSIADSQSNLIKNWEGPVMFYPSNAINGPVALYIMLKQTIPLLQEIKADLGSITTS